MQFLDQLLNCSKNRNKNRYLRSANGKRRPEEEEDSLVLWSHLIGELSILEGGGRVVQQLLGLCPSEQGLDISGICFQC